MLDVSGRDDYKWQSTKGEGPRKGEGPKKGEGPPHRSLSHSPRLSLTRTDVSSTRSALVSILMDRQLRFRCVTSLISGAVFFSEDAEQTTVRNCWSWAPLRATRQWPPPGMTKTKQ